MEKSIKLESFEDRIRKKKHNGQKANQYSRYCDFIYYQSTIHPELTLAMRILKPEKPSYILATTHGWHMSISSFRECEAPVSEYLYVEVDMRGRAYSEGTQDCNGWELYDVIDAIEYVKAHYQEYLLSTEVVYFEAGSGGGGNAYAIAGKFPDYFSHITAMCGISDYSLWYKNDEIGEFRDEMDIWIGSHTNGEAYRSRSGITTIGNLCTPMVITHGETDIRVPVEQAHNFVAEAKRQGKEQLVSYMELPGVGTREHWGNSTPEMLDAMTAFCEAERKAHQVPVSIPSKGYLTVAGYLVTKRFSVFMNSINRVTKVFYDLDAHELSVDGASPEEYVVQWHESI